MAAAGLTGLTLDRAFRDSAQWKQCKTGCKYRFICCCVVNMDVFNRLNVAGVPPEARFFYPGFRSVRDDGWSGYVGVAFMSLLGRRCRFPAIRSPGDTQFAALDRRCYAAVYAGVWEITPSQYRLYTFRVAET